MVKANHSDNSQKTKIEQATLVVFEEDIPEDYSWLGGTIDVTDIVYPCIEYIEQLRKSSNTLKLPKLLLHMDSNMMKFGVSLSHSDETQFIIDNMDNIADKIYQQYQTTELDLDNFTKMPIFDQFEAFFYRSV